MKKTFLTLILASCAMAMSAQRDVVSVNFSGAKPNISDFAWAFVSSYVYDEEEDVLNEALSAVQYAWFQYRRREPLGEGVTLTVDEKNGYTLYVSNDGGYSTRIEMCYWNESDQKHKLFAYNVRTFKNGVYESGQFDGLTFYRYDNATRKMTYCQEPPGFTQRYGTDDGARVSYALPRSGKNITETLWYSGGRKKQRILNWNGRRFSY